MSDDPLLLVGPSLPGSGPVTAWTLLLAQLAAHGRPVGLAVGDPAEWRALLAEPPTGSNLDRSKLDQAISVINYHMIGRDVIWAHCERLYVAASSGQDVEQDQVMSKAPGPIWTPWIGLSESDPLTALEAMERRTLASGLAQDLYAALTRGAQMNRTSSHLHRLLPVSPYPEGCTAIGWSPRFDLQVWIEGHALLEKAQYTAPDRTLIVAPSGGLEERVSSTGDFATDPGADWIEEGPHDPAALVSGYRAVIDLSPPSREMPSAYTVAAWLMDKPVVGRAGLWSARPLGAFYPLPPSADTTEVALRIARWACNRATMPRRKVGDPPVMPPLSPAGPASDIAPSLERQWLEMAENNRKDYDGVKELADAPAGAGPVLLTEMTVVNAWMPDHLQSRRLVRLADITTALKLARAANMPVPLALARFGYEGPVLADPQGDASLQRALADKHDLRLTSLADALKSLRGSPVAASFQPSRLTENLVRPVAGQTASLRLPIDLFNERPGVKFKAEDSCLVWRDSSERALHFLILTGQKCSLDLAFSWRVPAIRVTVGEAGSGRLLSAGKSLCAESDTHGILRLKLSLVPDPNQRTRHRSLWSEQRTLLTGRLLLTLKPQDDSRTKPTGHYQAGSAT